MITIYNDRSVYIPESDRHIGFENDNLVETRYFEINDTDISDFSFKLDIAESLDIVDLEKVELDDGKCVLVWNISAAAIGDGGIVRAQIRAFDQSGEKIWHSQIMEFVADESVNAEKQIDDTLILSEFEQLEMRATNAVSSAEKAAADAKNLSDTALSAANAAVKSADSASEFAENAQNCSKAACESEKNIAEAEKRLEESFGRYDGELNKAEKHYKNTDNPHKVTASQIGTYTKEEIDGLLENSADTDELFEQTPFVMTDFEYSLDYEDNDFDNFVNEDYVTSPFPHIITIRCAGETMSFSASAEESILSDNYARMKVNGEYVIDNTAGVCSCRFESVYMEEDIIIEICADSIGFSDMTRKTVKGYAELNGKIGDIDKALNTILEIQNQFIEGASA